MILVSDWSFWFFLCGGGSARKGRVDQVSGALREGEHALARFQRALQGPPHPKEGPAAGAHYMAAARNGLAKENKMEGGAEKGRRVVCCGGGGGVLAEEKNSIDAPSS